MICCALAKSLAPCENFAVVINITRLRETLIAGLSTIEHARLNGDREQRVPGTVNFCFEGIEGESLLLLLDRKGIAASSGIIS